jgi:hypothetical protein
MKQYSIDFDYYADLVKIGNELELALLEQQKGYIELLKKENIPFETDNEYGAPIVDVNYLRDKPYIINYKHPLLIEVLNHINIRKNI